jgi:IPT/TIG domain
VKIRFFATALCLALLSTLCLVIPVQALGMAPGEGVVGATVTISGLSAGSYSIKWDGVGVKQGTLSGGGSVSFAVPDTAGGNHTVAVDNPTGTEVLSATFSVLPSLAISTDTGVVGDEVTVSGKGFAVAEHNVVVSYDGTSVKTGIVAGNTGSWETTFTLPVSAKGSHTVEASGQTTQESDVPALTVTIAPEISANPSSGNVGSSINISGEGFGKSESGIQIIYDGGAIKTGISADSKGSWKSAFTIPNSTKGGHTIDASGASTKADEVPDLTFIVSSAVTIKPTSGAVGDAITVAGCGFGGNESGITVTLDGNVVKSDIAANNEGCWNSSITIPQIVGGNHTIDAYGDSTTSSEVADTKISVLSNLKLDPAEGNVGNNITINGSGFGADKELTLKYDSTEFVTKFTTDEKGNFQANVVAPKSVGGKHNITATDANGATATTVFNIETIPPAVPLIISPKEGGRAGLFDNVKPTFEWGAVTDPSGVSYSLQISSQSDFSTTLLSKDNLAEPKYTLTDAEALARGTYYWRVKAIDGASNDSGWSPSIEFKAGLMPLWLFIVVVIIAAVLVVRLFFFLRNMGKER